MSALTEARNTVELTAPMSCEREVASGSTIYAGALAAQNASGKAVPASDGAGLIVLGRAENTALAGETVRLRTGVYLYGNGTGTEALTVADIGGIAYVLDDQTVGKLGGTNKIPAGVVLDVTDEGVAVRVGPEVRVIPAVTEWTADPAAATAATLGQIYIVKTGWTGGTRISTGTAGDVYISTGAAYVKLN